MASTMHAVVIETPGGPEALEVRELPRPIPRSGEVLIRVEAFGVNRSEQHFRRGLGSFGSFPRVPGLWRPWAPSWPLPAENSPRDSRSPR